MTYLPVGVDRLGGPLGPAPAGGAPPAAPGTAPAGFGDALAARTANVTFSKHALQRLERRGIPVDPATMRRLGDGVDRVAAKGARESVVLVDRVAFVVSVPSRTVITAVGQDQMRSHVFTNIDSAVLA